MSKCLCSLPLLLLCVTSTSCAADKRAQRAPAQISTAPEQAWQAPIEKAPEAIRNFSAIPGSVGQLAFAFDDASLSAESQRSLEGIADVLLDAPELEISIEGHCDALGTSAYNLALGERRARAAQRYLVALGVEKSRVKVISFGEEMLANEGDAEAAHEANRRGEMTFFRRASTQAQAEPSFMRFTVTWNS